MLKLHGTSKNGELWLPNPQRELLARYLTSLDGCPVTMSLVKGGSSKSWSQVKVHFGLAVEMIRQRMIDEGWDIMGIAPNKQMIHDILSKCCGGVGPLGANVRLSEMDTKQCSQFFENIRDWAAKNLHVVIPDPDPNWKSKD